MKRIAFVPIGMPGSGKGVFTKTVTALFPDSVFCTDTGALLRSSIYKEQDALAYNDYHIERIREINASGNLQPSATAIAQWCRILQMEYSPEKNPYLVMDGSPRRTSEFTVMDEYLKEEYGSEVHYIHIKTTREKAIQNMERRHLVHPRPETSTRELISYRLDVYDKLVTPTIVYMKSRMGARYTEIDNNGTIENFEQEILQFLNKTLNTTP